MNAHQAASMRLHAPERGEIKREKVSECLHVCERAGGVKRKRERVRQRKRERANTRIAGLTYTYSQ